MAHYLFSSSRGSVVSVKDPTGSGAPAVLTITASGGKLNTAVAAIVNYGQVASAVAHQLSDTLGGDLYLTVFNKSPISVQVRALVFERTCRSGGSKGFAAFVKWWNSSNVHATDRSVRVSISGSTNVTGYLMGFSAGIDSSVAEAPGSGFIWSVTLNIIAAPSKESGGSSLSSDAGGGFGGDASNFNVADVVQPGTNIVQSPVVAASIVQRDEAQFIGVNNGRITASAASLAPRTMVLNANGDPIRPSSEQIYAPGFMEIGGDVDGVLRTIKTT